MNEKKIIKKISNMYDKYGVEKTVLERLSDENKMKGMKGVLAELDLKKNREYEEEDMDFIKKIYSIFC